MCESSAVRAVALLGPSAREPHIRPFEVPGVDLFIGDELDPTDQPDAALILGGDVIAIAAISDRKSTRLNSSH